MNESIWQHPTWFKHDPYGINGHKSCLDCQYFQTAGQPNRRCEIGLEKSPIFMGNSEQEMTYYETDKTHADSCTSYKQSETVGIEPSETLKVWDKNAARTHNNHL
jgi:hypothetical protein